MSPGPQSTQVPAVILELREQHRAIMNLFEQCALAKDGHAQMESSRSLCREIRLHISVEIGVFYPAVAREMGIPAILAEAGVEFAYVTQLVNEIADPKTDAHVRESSIDELRRHFASHIVTAESDGGIFERAMGLDLGWAVLQHEIRRRRSELNGNA